jgi:peptidoglycan/LPS O-acetylase OafA/YrhL
MAPITGVLDDAAGYRDAAPAALLFSINYWPAPPMALGHLWSVACEMQFYAVAPIVLLLGRGTLAPARATARASKLPRRMGFFLGLILFVGLIGWLDTKIPWSRDTSA